MNLLTDAEKTGFLIPTYQRGYKWASLDGKGQVDILLKDLHKAYSSDSNRYYLQFLTLKSKSEELEVIDGQQRLTTLTILLSVIEYVHKADDLDNYVRNKLKYQTRQNFIEKYIYHNIDQLLSTKTWEEFRGMDPENDNQDVYFIYHAAKAIYQFISINVSADILPFYRYISDSVYLIVNLLEENLDSERIFVNVNKGVRLNDEDLVKGLLITRLPLEHLNKNKKYRPTEIEINEWRTNLGRQWDDISNWASRPDTLSFFKASGGDSRLEWLIRLAYPDIGDDESDHPMFGYFDDVYTRNGGPAGEMFRNIRETKMILNDWYSEPETANLLGYILHSDNPPKKEKILQQLKACKTKNAAIISLKNGVRELLPLSDGGELKRDLNYEEHSGPIFNVFLILDVAKFLPLNGHEATHYDFEKISSGNWTLEHIFPQNARDLKKVERLSKDDLKIIRELIKRDNGSLKSEQLPDGQRIRNLYDKIQQSTEECVIDNEERGFLGKLLSDNAPDLHKIGNLALLEGNINSSLSNHFFNEKRKRLVRKIGEGKFVPFHTYDVFSKLLFSTDTGLHAWSKQDILKHEDYIHLQMTTIINYLNLQ